MGAALSLSILAIAFSIFIVLFFDFPKVISFEQMQSTLINYTSQGDHGFIFSYPSNWIIVNNTHKENGVITLSPPNNYDLFGEKMTFGMEKLHSNISLDEYSKKAIKILSTTLQEFHLVDSYPFVMSDSIWERILFTHETDKGIIKVLQYWTIIDGHVYIISFGSTPDSYFGYIPTVSKIISGMKIFANNTAVQPENYANVSIYSSPAGLVLKYRNTWNKELAKNRVSFISNQENPNDRYLERVDFYYYGRNDNFNATIPGENEFIRVDLIDEINYLANNFENLELISVDDMNFSKVLGKKIVYTYTSNLGATKSEEVMIRSSTNIYKIIFTTQKD